MPSDIIVAPSCSVVVPTRDRPDGLRRLLHTLDALHGLIPLEVVVVDGSQSQATKPVLDAWLDVHHPFTPKVVLQRPARGPGQARNLGTLVATSEVVAFTDDDCQVDPRWLANLLSRLRGGSIAGVGGKVLPVRRDVVSRYYTFHRILEPPPSRLYLVSANCCYLRRALLDVGGFDEEIRKPGGEDVGLSFKLTRVGWKFEYAPHAIVYHDYRSNPLDFLHTFRNYGRGCRQVTEKHFGNGGIVHDVPSSP